MTRLVRAIGLLFFFFWELILSSLRVARDVLSPNPKFRPGIVGIPLDIESDAGITLLAVLVTLTPGTLSLDVSEDRKTLFVHGMRIEDPEAFRREIKDGFERRIRGLLP